MKISHENPHWVLKEYYFADIASRNCLHIIIVLCWLSMLFVGTTIIGVGTSNTYLDFPYCQDSFCTYNFVANSTTQLFFYIKSSGYYQNNRMFMDFFSIKQLHGEIDNPKHCGQYYTYGSISKTSTVGGYRIKSLANIHPCGEVMSSYSADSVYLVDSQGGTPNLDNGDLISSFNSNYHFQRLNQYQLSQWVDVQSQQFVNYFTIPATSVKYQLVGKASVSNGNYQIVIQNSYGSQGQLTKQLIVTEVGWLGVTNQVLGFTLFSYGLLLLFTHVYVCFRWRK